MRGQPGTTIQVMLVEDDVSFRASVMAAIEAAADVRMARVAETRQAGLALLEGAAADVLIVDLGLPDGSGIDVIRAARSAWPRCEVIVATVFGDEDKSPMIARQLLRRLQPAAIGLAPRAASAEADENLSGREAQVLERMALGYTMQETADFLGVAMSTVQTYVRRIYQKLGVNSKVEAIDAGYRRGLLQGR
jgi:DNA-binding NarL/FixJ family response regulator